MVKGIKNTAELLRLNNNTCWRIKRSQKGEKMFDCPSDNLSIDESTEELTKRLQLLDSGVYLLETWTEGKSGNSHNYISFEIERNGGPAPVNVSNIGAITPDEVQSKIDKALNDYKTNQEIDRLKTENKELKDKYDNVVFRILERAEPYIGTILGNIFPKNTGVVPAITGISNNNNNMDLNTRAEKALENWLNVDQDAIILLEKIVKLAQTNQSMYNQAKNMLLNF